MHALIVMPFARCAMGLRPAAASDVPVGRVRWVRCLLCLLMLAMTGCASQQTLRGKVVVITGASSGFGKGVALKAAGEGAAVVVAARRTVLLDELAQQIEGQGGRALAVTTDVARDEDMQRLAQAALDRFGRIDVWVNNAGVGSLGAFDEVPLADHKRIIAVNLDAVITGSYIALQQFRRQGAGTLINIGSISSELPFPYYASYAASKHGVLGLGNSLHQELRTQGSRDIHVCTILPFAADTPWFDHAAHHNGRAPRMVLMDPAGKVVDAIVDAMKRPRRQVSVGYKAKLAIASNRVLPGPTQHMIGTLMQHVQDEIAPAAPDGEGAMHAPVPEGTGVDGGVRERMRQERKARSVQERRQ